MRYGTTYTKKSTSKKIIDSLKSFGFYRVFGILLILGVLGIGAFYLIFLRGIPDIASLERGDYFKESTIIYDKNKNPIYTLFNGGKRTYIDNKDISQLIKDAIVSTEDKTFFTNPGIDAFGLVRAVGNYVTGHSSRVQGTSTISQQLIRNTILTNERSLKRKIQEAYLSYDLNNSYSKDKILEMYLNAFSFGYNADGIEEAAKTYFGKSAKEVGPLGASILASLPKGPTYYSPYLHRDRLMGNVYIYPISDPANITSLEGQEARTRYGSMYIKFRSYLSGMTIEGNNSRVNICGVKKDYTRATTYAPDSQGCINISHDDLLGFYGDIIIKEEHTSSGNTDTVALEYTIGRKDFVAGRMFEDGKIDGPTFKKIIFDGLEFEFRKYTENIKYPYFVMYIKEYLETKYGKDIDIAQGLKVYTTIDPVLQDKAEEILKKQVAINKTQYGASSAAIVSMDNVSGRLLVMVGGPDYFDIEHGGNNNMALARRQPGSSFKPFVYSLAISKNPIGPDSPVADVKTTFGKYAPNNYDGGFKGIMPVKRALDYSRNIPAVKMFFLAGGEDAIKEQATKMGLNFTSKVDGAALAIGSNEVRPIDLLQAYSVFANEGIKRDIYAVDKIEDNDGNILEEQKKPKEALVFSPEASYVLTKILSDVDSRPEGFWRSALTISGGRVVAAKTGTSNKDVSKGGEKKILPRDLWTAGYSKQITTVVWAGNVDGHETKGTCDGLNCAANIWKGFMEFAHKELPKEDWKKPEGVYTYTIAKNSGKLATENTPDEQKISTIMAVKLTEYDDGMKEEKIDTLCNGPTSENTPSGAIASIFIPTGKPVIDGYDPSWLAGFFEAIGATGGSGSTLVRSDKPCERPEGVGNIAISMQIVGLNNNTSEGKKILETSWIGDRIIKNFTLKYKDKVISNIDFGTGGKMAGSNRTSINLEKGNHTFAIEITDIFGYRYMETKIITIGSDTISPNTPPVITLTNPKENDQNISLYLGDTFNLRFSVKVPTLERELTVRMDDTIIQNATTGDVFVIPISSSGLNPGIHSLVVKLTDGNLSVVDKKITVTILPR